MPIMPRAAGHKSKRIKALFRRLVRKVMLCKVLLVEMDAKIGLNAKRNVIILTRRKRSTSLLSSNEKMLFQKPVANRTVADRETLVKLVAGLKCFQIFPPKVRARITSHLHYIKIDRNRNILRQGHVPVYVYFVLHGEIVAHNLCEDIYSKKSYRKDRFISASGDIVGHLAIFSEAKRNFTFTAITDVDCLYMDSDIFSEHLFPYVKRAIAAKYLAMSKLYFLDNLNNEQRSFVALFGKLKEFQAMETVYYKDQGDLNYIYFIISGQCMILQHLKTMTVKTEGERETVVLCPPKTMTRVEQTNSLFQKGLIYLIKEIKKRESIHVTSQSSFGAKYSSTNLLTSESENIFIDVGTLSYGAMFGLGEPMESRAIMARTNVQCLLLPRFWLFAKEQNPGNIWQRLQLSFKNVIPSREELFDYCKINKKWINLSKDYIYETLDKERNTSNRTKIEDIPLICRIVEHNLQDNDKEN